MKKQQNERLAKQRAAQQQERDRFIIACVRIISTSYRRYITLRIYCTHSRRRERAEETALENARRAHDQFASPPPTVVVGSPPVSQSTHGNGQDARQRMREIERRKRHEMNKTKIDMNAQSELMATFEGMM